MSRSFRVEGRELLADEVPAGGGSFAVRSVPRPYRVEWDEAPDVRESINRELDGGGCLLIDEKLWGRYARDIRVPAQRVFAAPASEEFKTLDGVTRLVGFLQDNRFTKGDTLVVVGGGTIQDVGAFAGAVFKRGIGWVHLPTTLLAMCDSCIGGKTGINHGGAKNQLALFSAPSRVVINPRFLDTLEEREVRSGLGEVLKLHVIGGPGFLRSFTGTTAARGAPEDPEEMRRLVLDSLLVKKAVVEEDEFELDLRRCLNYGHTVGHAIEALTDYRVPHGQAVAAGMLLADEIGLRTGVLSAADHAAIGDAARAIAGPATLRLVAGLPARGYAPLLRKDKKTMGDLVTFVVPASVGDTRFLRLPLDDELVALLDAAARSACGGQ